MRSGSAPAHLILSHAKAQLGENPLSTASTACLSLLDPTLLRKKMSFLFDAIGWRQGEGAHLRVEQEVAPCVANADQEVWLPIPACGNPQMQFSCKHGDTLRCCSSCNSTLRTLDGVSPAGLI